MPEKDHKTKKLRRNYKNSEIPLYPEMVIEVFRLCWTEAKIAPNRKGAIYELGRVLNKKCNYSEDDIEKFPNFLNYMWSDTHTAINNPELRWKQKGRSKEYMMPMLQLARIEDRYRELNHKFRRDEAIFVFRETPFSLFNLMRITHETKLIVQNNTWSFKCREKEYSGGEITEIKLYTMPGDKTSRWLRVTHTPEGHSQTIYFAEYEGTSLKIQDETTLLYHFFAGLR